MKKTLNKEQVVRLLKAFEELNNQLPYLNHGGCGVFALYAYYMFKRLGYKPELIVFVDEHWEEELVDTYIKHNNPSPGSHQSHVVLKIDGWYVDSEKITIHMDDIKDRHWIPVYGLKYALLRQWLKDIPSWNRFFMSSREKYESIIRSFFIHLLHDESESRATRRLRLKPVYL